eukprot:scaffold13190_cov170-Skeletonema_dohrnii-CCMP3373.AAC.1
MTARKFYVGNGELGSLDGGRVFATSAGGAEIFSVGLFNEVGGRLFVDAAQMSEEFCSGGSEEMRTSRGILRDDDRRMAAAM